MIRLVLMTNWGMESRVYKFVGEYIEPLGNGGKENEETLML